MQRLGLHPSHLPIDVMLDQDADGNAVHTSTCIRCDRVDGFPCLVDGKAYGQTVAVDPALAHPSLELVRNAKVERLETNGSGRTVTAVVAILADGSEARFSGDVVVVSCGALNSALLLLKSANDTHDDANADGSDGAGVAADRVAHGGEDDRGRDAHERSKSRSEELVGVDSRDQVASGNPIGNSKMLAGMPNLAATI